MANLRARALTGFRRSGRQRSLPCDARCRQLAGSKAKPARASSTAPTASHRRSSRFSRRGTPTFRAAAGSRAKRQMQRRTRRRCRHPSRLFGIPQAAVGVDAMHAAARCARHCKAVVSTASPRRALVGSCGSNRAVWSKRLPHARHACVRTVSVRVRSQQHPVVPAEEEIPVALGDTDGERRPPVHRRQPVVARFSCRTHSPRCEAAAAEQPQPKPEPGRHKRGLECVCACVWSFKIQFCDIGNDFWLAFGGHEGGGPNAPGSGGSGACSRRRCHICGGDRIAHADRGTEGAAARRARRCVALF